MYRGIYMKPRASSLSRPWTRLSVRFCGIGSGSCSGVRASFGCRSLVCAAIGDCNQLAGLGCRSRCVAGGSGVVVLAGRWVSVTLRMRRFDASCTGRPWVSVMLRIRRFDASCTGRPWVSVMLRIRRFDASCTGRPWVSVMLRIRRFTEVVMQASLPPFRGIPCAI
jgi:hypothetical protein